jgi:hypothetical protein
MGDNSIVLPKLNPNQANGLNSIKFEKPGAASLFGEKMKAQGKSVPEDLSGPVKVTIENRDKDGKGNPFSRRLGINNPGKATVEIGGKTFKNVEVQFDSEAVDAGMIQSEAKDSSENNRTYIFGNASRPGEIAARTYDDNKHRWKDRL